MPRLGLFAIAIVVGSSAGPGCFPFEPPNLVVLTDWPPSRRLAFEVETRSWNLPEPIRWRWLEAGPSGEVGSLDRIDLVLGLPASQLERLRRQGRLGPQGRWFVMSRSTLGFAFRPSQIPPPAPDSWSRLAAPQAFGIVALDDPRLDLLARVGLRANLRDDAWAEGYAELVLASGNARNIGRGGWSISEVETGAASIALAAGVEGPISDEVTFEPIASRPRMVEGGAIAPESPHRALAEALIQRLADEGRAEPPRPEDQVETDSDADSLLADLLGSTLVDAQDELRRAVDALSLVKDPARYATLVRFLTQAPPWPPASISKIKQRPDPAPFLETLAREIVPDREAREWVLARWREAERPIDKAWLDRLAELQNGELAHEPRFRAWLKAEWTAWARQRYRRVARVASGAFVP